MASKTLPSGKKVLVGSKADPDSKKSKSSSSSSSIDYTKSANESIDQYNARIAAARENQSAQETGSFSDGVPMRNYEQTNPYGYYGTADNQFPNTPENPRSPTVLSNASILEQKIPRLISQANALPTFQPAATFGDVSENSSGSLGEDYNFDEILGIGGDRKNKKKGLHPGYVERNTPNVREADPYMDDPILKEQLSLLKSMQRSADAATNEQLASTQAAFEQRRQEQQRANEQGLASVKQALNLGGSSRYAPISSQGIVSAAEAAGIRALADLDMKERQVISEIRQAQQSNDYQLMESKLNLLDGVRKEKAAATATLNETVRAQNMQASRDNAIAGLVAQGVTNPIEMLNALNFDEQGNQIGDFTIGEVTGALKSLNEFSAGGGIGFKLDNKAIGQLLGTGWTAPDIQAMQADLNSGASIDDILDGVPPEMQQSVKDALGIKEGAGPVTIGKGAKTELDEQLIRTRLFSKLQNILNKGTLSDADRAIIDQRIVEFREAGLGEQEILDTLAGIPPEVATPYNSAFRDIIVSNSDTLDKQNYAIGRLATQLASKNYKSAMNTAENLAMTEARKLDPDAYMGTNSASNYLKKTKELKALLDKSEDIVGPIQGSYQNALGRFRGKEATELRGKIAALVAEMRNDLSGTAVTESEAKFLEPLIAGLEDTSGSFKAKVNSLEDNVLGKYNSTRSSVSLPDVTIDQAIDPNKRLMLYSSDIYSTNTNSIDI